MLFIFDASHKVTFKEDGIERRLYRMFLVKAKTEEEAGKKVEPFLKRYLNLSIEEFVSLIGNAESDGDDNARRYQVTFESRTGDHQGGVEMLR